MKNELKLNIIELIKEIEDLHEVYGLKIREGIRGVNSDAVKTVRHNYMLELDDEASPLINELNDLIQARLTDEKIKEDKEELQKCIDFMKILPSISNQGYMGEFKWRMNDLKLYLEGLVENDEQLHGTAAKQSPASKSGKAPGDQ